MRIRVIVFVAAFLGVALLPSVQASAATASPEPFGSWAAMVDRLYADLTGVAPTANQRSAAVSALSVGTLTRGQFITNLRSSDDNLKNVDPTTRLYRAFLLRIPDAGGLNFWIGLRRAGTWTLVRMADHFAGSREFTTRYGPLSNLDFVKLVYANVLERQPDQGGLDFWTLQLDAKRKTRGSVMANFSESSEYKRKQAAEVHVSVLSIAMLKRAPTADEFAARVAEMEGGGSVADYAAELLGSTEYARTVIMTGARQVAGGLKHTCALLTNTTARCWGANDWGQVGDGTLANYRRTPVVVSGLTGAASISTGDDHSCAVLNNGTAKCWGANRSGQLGDGTTTDRNVPVVVAGLTGVTQITAGGDHTCALLSNKTAKCWGDNVWGQVGDGTTDDRKSPVTVAGITGATQIAAGNDHVCALLSHGTARCWGFNNNGQLGNGTTTDSKVPVIVSGLTGASQIAAGASHTCAVLTIGTAMCWGYGSLGTIGDGFVASRSTPATVSGLTAAVQMAAGYNHTCALLSNGTATCWGYGQFGALGNGTKETRLTPVGVTGLTDIGQITAGGVHTCAARRDGTAKCWGANEWGQVGDGTGTDRSVPVAVMR